VTPRADSITASHTAAEDAQNPTTDDDSYRTIPVRHRDYGHTEGDDGAGAATAASTKGDSEEDNKQERIFTMKEGNNRLGERHAGSHDVDVSLETAEDLSERSKREHLNINLKDEHAVEEAEIKAPHSAKEEHKLVDMAFHSKLMGQSKDQERPHANKGDAEVDDDEWDTTPADDYNRRETVAGM